MRGQVFTRSREGREEGRKGEEKEILSHPFRVFREFRGSGLRVGVSVPPNILERWEDFGEVRLEGYDQRAEDSPIQTSQGTRFVRIKSTTP
jgi:hypothetical protein